MLQKDICPVDIRVPDIQRFAYGQYDDGEVAVWALGKAGWYKIQPSRKYKDVFRQMMEAINALYFAVDYYRQNKRLNKRQAPVENLFQGVCFKSHLCR